jgi:hypothetical protein
LTTLLMVGARGDDEKIEKHFLLEDVENVAF